MTDQNNIKTTFCTDIYSFFYVSFSFVCEVLMLTSENTDQNNLGNETLFFLPNKSYENEKKQPLSVVSL